MLVKPSLKPIYKRVFAHSARVNLPDRVFELGVSLLGAALVAGAAAIVAGLVGLWLLAAGAAGDAIDQILVYNAAYRAGAGSPAELWLIVALMLMGLLVPAAAGALRPGERLMMKMPFADSRSRSRLIRARTSAGSAPFQLWNGWIAPYSRGGALKFAATSAVDGTVTTCHGRGDCA